MSDNIPDWYRIKKYLKKDEFLSGGFWNFNCEVSVHFFFFFFFFFWRRKISGISNIDMNWEELRWENEHICNLIFFSRKLQGRSSGLLRVGRILVQTRTMCSVGLWVNEATGDLGIKKVSKAVINFEVEMLSPRQ